MSEAPRTERIALPDGRKIACERAGTGPVVFLLHGIGGARTQWAAQIADFATRYSVIAPDARGYGDSDGPPVMAFADFAADLLALADALGCNRFLAVGHSMGGRILLEVAARAPQRIASLVLSGTQARYLGHMTQADAADYIDRRRTLFDGQRVRADKIDGIVDGLLHPEADAAARDRMRRSLGGLHRDAYLAALEASVGMDRTDILRHLAMPTLVIGGDSDPVCPASVCAEIADLIPNSEAHILQSVGHMPNLEAPERFNTIVGAFLDRHAHRAAPTQRDRV